MVEINEGTTGYLSATFKNKLGVAQVPTSANYRIDDVATGTEIRGVTAITPAETAEIELSSSDNRLLNSQNRHELKRVTVVASYGSGDVVTAEYQYRVKALPGVSGNPPAIVS